MAKNKSELGFKLSGWVVSILITSLVIAAFVAFFAQRELRATLKSRKIQVGDVFSVHMVSNNPYADDLMFGGTVTATNGVYLQYVTDDGDTMSTNIRDCYLFPNTCRVVVVRKEKAAD